MKNQQLHKKIGTVAIDKMVICKQYWPEQAEHKNDKTPAQVKHWNWGAFLLPWLWGIGNRVPAALLALIPPVYPFVAFWLGKNGGRKAWENQHWQDEHHFRATQGAWAMAAVTCYSLAVVAIAGLAATGFFVPDQSTQTKATRTIATGPVKSSSTVQRVNVALQPTTTKAAAGVYALQLPLKWQAELLGDHGLLAAPPVEKTGASLSFKIDILPSQDLEQTIKDTRLATMRDGGIMHGEKDLKLKNEVPAKLLIFGYVDAQQNISYGQFMFVKTKAGILVARTTAAESSWALAEAVYEKSLLSIELL